MTDIPLDLIRPNPFRDFDLHPIDDAQVEKLRASINSTGRFWSGVVARPGADAHYELAFGHHRIAAARQANIQVVPIEVCDLSNEMMALMLASENATQRGITAAASLDAVAALSRAVTESCLRCETPEQMGQIWPISGNAVQTVWGKIRHGGQPGRDCIQLLLPAYTHHQIDLALHVLRDSGRLGGAEVSFDARCARLFRLDYHLAVFRKFATGDTVRSYLPVENQLDFATHVMEHLNGLHHLNEITADMIRTACWERMESALGIPKNMLRDAPDRPALDQIKEGLNRIRRALSDFAKGTDMLLRANDEPLSDVQSEQLDDMLGGFDGNLAELRGRKGKSKLKVVGRD